MNPAVIKLLGWKQAETFSAVENWVCVFIHPLAKPPLIKILVQIPWHHFTSHPLGNLRPTGSCQEGVVGVCEVVRAVVDGQYCRPPQILGIHSDQNCYAPIYRGRYFFYSSVHVHSDFRKYFELWCYTQECIIFIQRHQPVFLCSWVSLPPPCIPPPCPTPSGFSLPFPPSPVCRTSASRRASTHRSSPSRGAPSVRIPSGPAASWMILSLGKVPEEPLGGFLLPFFWAAGEGRGVRHLPSPLKIPFCSNQEQEEGGSDPTSRSKSLDNPKIFNPQPQSTK